MRRPWYCRRWQNRTRCFSGTSGVRSNSILSGLVFFVNPSRCERRMTWVSTPMVCCPKALPSTILAVFLPTPGRVRRSSSLSGTLPLKRLDDLAAAVVNRASFIPVEIDFADLFFQFRQRLAGIVFRRSVFLEKIGSYPVDEIVPGLCCQDQSDEQLQGIGKIQVELGVRMGLFQPLDDLLNLHFFPSA